MFRVIKEAKPRWILAENVTGIVKLALGQVLSDLESIGYDFPRDHEGTPIVPVIPACGLNAPHRRYRVWIVAYCKSRRTQRGSISIRQGKSRKATCNIKRIRKNVANTRTQRLSRSTCKKFKGFQCQEKSSSRSNLGRAITTEWDSWVVEPDVGRVAYGIPSRVHRIKALGNAIIPQIAFEIMKRIAWIERNESHIR